MFYPNYYPNLLKYVRWKRIKVSVNKVWIFFQNGKDIYVTIDGGGDVGQAVQTFVFWKEKDLMRQNIVRFFGWSRKFVGF